MIVGAANLRAFILPRPSVILAALQENWSGGQYAILPSTQATLFEALGGLVIGTVAGVLVALATARWASARAALLPFAIAAGAIPIIAIAPLMNNWFGVLSPLSKMMMAAVLVFFPVMVNVTRGLVQVDPAALELMRSYAASECAVLRKVRIPNALPFFFTALKLGRDAEPHRGDRRRVLRRRRRWSSAGSSSRARARFVSTSPGRRSCSAAATGIVLYLVISAVERLVIPWHASVRPADS